MEWNSHHQRGKTKTNQWRLPNDVFFPIHTIVGRFFGSKIDNNNNVFFVCLKR